MANFDKFSIFFRRSIKPSNTSLIQIVGHLDHLGILWQFLSYYLTIFPILRGQGGGPRSKFQYLYMSLFWLLSFRIFLQNQKILIFHKIMAGQSCVVLQIHREIPIYKKSAIFSTWILGKTIEVWGYALKLAQIRYIWSQ